MQGSFISEAEYRSRIAALEDALAERNTDGSIGTAAYARSYGLPVHP